MGTIAQELARIQNAKASLKTSIENKGVQVPANTLIDGYPALVDQITGGGGDENKFLTLTDLSYLFAGRNLDDEKILDGLKRFSQNSITDINYAFQTSKITTNDIDLQVEIINYIKTILSSTNNLNARYAFYNARYTLSNPVIDMSNSKIYNANNMFCNINADANAQWLRPRLKSDSLKNCTDISNMFYGAKASIQLDTNELHLENCGSITSAFEANGYRKSFRAYDHSIYTDMHFYLPTNSMSGANLLRLLGNLENAYMYNMNKITNVNQMFEQITTLKSIHGFNPSGHTGSYIASPFGNTANYLTDFGELDIPNGLSLGSNYFSELRLTKIWNATQDTIKNGQTIGYWFEKFANNLGAASRTFTISIHSTLYSSLSTAQKALITDKGYTLSSGT